jgi:hypothetical protein
LNYQYLLGFQMLVVNLLMMDFLLQLGTVYDDLLNKKCYGQPSSLKLCYFVKNYRMDSVLSQVH